MGRSGSGSYYKDFRRYGGRGSYDYKQYYTDSRETNEQRAARKAEERRRYEERHEGAGTRHESFPRDDDSHKRKTHDDRGKSHIEDSRKRTKLGEEHVPVTSERPGASVSIDVPSKSPALEGSAIQTLLNRPSYHVERGPPTLQSRFPNWCLRGVRFDLDLVPIDKEAMYRNLDAVKLDIDRMSGWQKLVDELQRVNRANIEAMLTMENDKSEWQKILDQHNAEMKEIAEYNEKLEAEVKQLKDDLVSSTNTYTQREEVLQKQVRDAHASQRDAEAKAERLEQAVENHRTDVTQLQNKLSARDMEIEALKAQLAQTEKDRDEAMAGKIAAEETPQTMENDINSTLFDFYLHCVLGRGSLSFLGPKYEITLAEVWEAALSMFKDAGYGDGDFEARYLDEEARAALAKGREQLARMRTGMAEEECSGKELTLISSVHPPVSPVVDITGSSSSTPPATKTVTETTSAQGGDEGGESNEAQRYEISLRDPTAPGKLDTGPVQVVNCSFAPCELDDLLDYFSNVNEFPTFDYSSNVNEFPTFDEPSSPLFSKDTDILSFFSFVEKAPSQTQASSPPVILPPSLQVAPPSASQPGSQEEQIEALHGLDDPIASQEQKDEGLEGGDISPERTPSDDITLSKLVTPGSESSSKRRRKQGASRRRGKIITATEEEPEVGPAAPTSPSSLIPTGRPEKLVIRPGKGSKGSKKK